VANHSYMLHGSALLKGAVIQKTACEACSLSKTEIL